MATRTLMAAAGRETTTVAMADGAWRRWRGPILVLVILVVQAACALFFVSDILFSVLGIYARPIAWRTREMLELGAALGLVLGLLLGAIAFWRLARDHRRTRARLDRASSAFVDLMEQRFGEWELTTSERDVALFAIKGLSTAEIAGLRGVAEGTIKAQTNAIYRKAGVNGRPQLLSLFIEDLMEARPPAPRQPE